jgi:hypothetical protein
MNRKILISCLIMIALIFLGCKKDQGISNQDQILGTWISVDKIDTLNFVDRTNLWRSDINMYSDHYDYQLINDSIKIGYSGKLYIYVLPTKHRYYLNGNNMSIDFSNRLCYGFDLRVINYIRKLDE